MPFDKEARLKELRGRKQEYEYYLTTMCETGQLIREGSFSEYKAICKLINKTKRMKGATNNE
jgi:hypothetical protein